MSDHPLFPKGLFLKYLENLDGFTGDPKSKADEGASQERQSFNVQGKKISQYTTRLWLDLQSSNQEVREKAQASYHILSMGPSEAIIDLLKKEIGVNLEEIWGTPLTVYPDWSIYGAKHEEMADRSYQARLPVPPRASEEMLPSKAIFDWIDSDPEKEPFFPEHPYIPLSGGG